ncbi:MAG: phosphopantetheine-binding protein [Candidatus Thiodiazotropha sp.]
MNTQFKLELKQMIVDECRLDEFNAEDIKDDEYLAGPEARFGLDSIDMLQVIVTIKNRYGIHIQNDADSREILATINNLADFLHPE